MAHYHEEHLCETTNIQSLSSKTPEQQLAAVAEAIVSMGNNVNQFYKDVKHRYKVLSENVFDSIGRIVRVASV